MEVPSRRFWVRSGLVLVLAFVAIQFVPYGVIMSIHLSAQSPPGTRPAHGRWPSRRASIATATKRSGRRTRGLRRSRGSFSATSPKGAPC